MKKLFMSIMLISVFAVSKAQTADEIVSKHVEARGEKARFDKIQSVVMEGSISVQGATVNLVLTKVAGKLNRQDISFMGTNGFDLTTDKEGWSFLPFAGQTAPVEKTGDALKEAQKQLGVFSDDMLIDYQANESKLELQGKEDINGTDCFKLKLTSKSGDSASYYIDPANYQIVRISTVKQFNGQNMPFSVDLSDYKDVEGVKFPFSMSTLQGPMVFTSIKVNQPIDEKKYKHE